MRADRLISLIMLLETKGPLTAKELAKELEVSERTIYRDIDSLSAVGIPVYGEPGPDGGYRLIEGYTSYLNKLNKNELMALLSVNIPDIFDQLEIGSKIKSALLKIQSSYEHISMSNDSTILGKLYIDSTIWNKNDDQVRDKKSLSHLSILYNALCNNQKLHITYQDVFCPTDSFTKLIEPYGLVYKEDEWYLVHLTQGRIRVLELYRIIHIEETGQPFTYPKDFDLQSFWQEWCKKVKERFSSFQVKALVPKTLKTQIYSFIKNGRVPIRPLPIDYQNQEWVEIDLYFESFEDARSKLLAFGGVIKVLEPISLRYSLIDYASQILNLYLK